jgi:hypothetical protein
VVDDIAGDVYGHIVSRRNGGGAVWYVARAHDILSDIRTKLSASEVLFFLRM